VSESPETPKILEQLSKSNSAKVRDRSSRQQQNARRRIALIVMLFLPVLAGVLFLAYQQRLSQIDLSSLRQENQQLNLALSAQATQLQQLQRDLAEPPQAVPVDESALRLLESNFDAEIGRLRQQLAAVQSQQRSTAVEPSLRWKLQEAEYLLGVASQKLLLEGDTNSAIALLEDADAALLASGNNGVYATREAISAELLQLRNVEAIDRQGLYIRIGILATQLANVEMLSSMRQNFENRRFRQAQSVEVGISNSSDSVATGWFGASLDFLGSVFVWRQREESPVVMLAPGSESVIRQNLQLMLEQTQLALLMRDNALYQRSLGKSMEWIRLYVSTDTSSGQLVVDGLLELGAIDIDPTLPSLGESLDSIRRVIASGRPATL
jgi:uroporphyrin-3 C-methyltransferase